MTCKFLIPPLLGAAALAAQAPAPIAAPAPALAAGDRAVDLAICLDVSGSMDGLLDAARQNLWAVVNELAALQPTPQLRVALLTYGCPRYEPAAGWVRVDTGFTGDLDLVSQRLFALRTNGGDEYVARVVQTALGELQWSADPSALKLLFVCGNEAASQDPAVDFRAQSRAAIGRGIIVNSIYCGSPGDGLAPEWREVATLAEGRFAAIEQDKAVIVATPFDQQLVELGARLNQTYVPFGAAGAAMQSNQVAQDRNAVEMNVAAAAQRSQTKGGQLYFNGHWDLVDASRGEGFVLADVAPEDLPAAMRAMTLDERKAYIATKQHERDALRAEIGELGARRDAHVRRQLEARAGGGEAVFEDAVLAAVRQQAAARGFRCRERAAPAAAVDQVDQEMAFADELRRAVVGYREFVRVTGTPHVAPTDCRMPAPLARLSAATAAHGRKLYLLYARQAEGLEYIQPGVAAAVGQTLVKEAWEVVEGPLRGPTEASARYAMAPSLVHEGKELHAGAAAGLFVMHKLAPDTAGTDRGWIYGTIDRRGAVTSAGRVASCIRCHERAVEDRRFGLR